MSAVVLYGSICLTDIPKEAIINHKNGKKYLNLKIIKKKQTDPYGNTHFVSCEPKMELRNQNSNYIIGNFHNPNIEELNNNNKPYNQNTDLPF